MVFSFSFSFSFPFALVCLIYNAHYVRTKILSCLDVMYSSICNAGGEADSDGGSVSSSVSNFNITLPIILAIRQSIHLFWRRLSRGLPPGPVQIYQRPGPSSLHSVACCGH
ncbi:hypothetical protein LZ30DRAFT_227718 [Colletotrichum cereale]|nr:hypothetical protein LZ30DRAFT_227718 [Colletotrichum cereale]